MKSYLSLIPISEKKHKKQSKMTRVCIILAVFLVTSIFSMAEMEMQSQLRQAIRDNGYWHLTVSKISEQDGDKLENIPGVELACAYGVTNYRLDQGYTVNGKNVIICGFDNSFQTIYDSVDIDGAMPEENNEALVSRNMAKELNKGIGDSVNLSMPDGTESAVKITGVVEDTADLSTHDCYGMDMNVEAFKNLTGETQDRITYFVKVKKHANVRKTIDHIKKEFEGSDAKIGENIKLLGITGKSKDSYMIQLYAVAAVLAVLVITAGVLMITSNINSNLSKRTEFFGMLRCLGASKRQIRNFVILEALNWCVFSIPIGVLLGSAISSILCVILRTLSPAYFADMPAIAISPMGVLMGCVIGLITVLLAAIAPANKAAKVSPLTAVSGNAYSGYQKSSKIHLWLIPIEVKLGIHHSYNSKKNFFLMVSSFALSIILFLAFSTGVDFLHHALKPLQVYTPDLSIYSNDNSCIIDKSVVDEIKQMNGVKNVYGRSFSYDIPSLRNQTDPLKINLLTYESKQFEWSKKKIVEGDINNVIAGEEVMTVFNPSKPLHLGDKLTIETESGKSELTVGAILSDSPFSREKGCETVICSESTFEKVTGMNDYTIVDVQLKSDSFLSDESLEQSNEVVDHIHALFSDRFIFSDQRTDNSNVRGAYLSMSVFIYGFIVIIALISIFQVINSIAMSVNSRIHQYGTMRAIGAANSQLMRMIVAESVTYGLFGILTGCVVGIPLHKLLFTWLITSRWGDAWQIPVNMLLIIMLVITVFCLIAVVRPVKEIKDMSIVDTLTTF